MITTWYVLFEPRNERTHWVHWFINREFVHVTLAKETPEGKVLAISFQRYGAEFAFVDVVLDEYLLAHAERLSALLSFTTCSKDEMRGILRGQLNCVSFVKACLHLIAPMTFTPKQLYRRLLKEQYATVIKPWSPWMRKVVYLPR